MRRKIVASFILILSILSAIYGCNSTEYDQKVKNVEAFAECYGMVRWFYPGDELQGVDWNQLAIYGVSQVTDCKSTDELKAKLEDIFTTMAPGIFFSDSSQYDLRKITPADTTGMSIVSWQHYGVDLGLYSNIYTSKRTNRTLNTQNVSKLAIEGILPASDFINSEVTVSIPIKNDTPDKLKIFFRAAVNKSGEYDYVRFCVADTTMLPIDNSGEWQVYTQKLKVNPEAANSLIRYGLYTDGEGSFSIGNITVHSSGISGNLKNHGQLPNYTVYDYVYDGTSWNISTKSKLFDKQNHFGDVATRKLASDLYIHVPLALYGTFSQTYPACNKTEFKEQLTKIAAINNASDTSMMLADITVCWNAVKYFDPYLSDLNSDWNKELRKAVESALSYTTYSSRPLKVMMAVLKDAHVMVNSPKDNIAPKAYLPIAVKKLDGKLFVAHALNSTLVAGDEIESVNGENAIDTFEYFEREISGHPQHNAVKAEPLWLRSFSDYDSVDINLKRDGKSIKVSTSPISRENYIQKMSPYYLGGNSRWIKDNILYLNLINTDFQTVSRLLFDRKDDTTVIIDIREGTQFHFATILPLLVDEESLIPFRDGISNIPCITTPDTPVIRDTLTDITHRTPNKKNIFLTGPLIYSHGEEVLDYVRYAGLGCLIGTNTGGCNGRINVIPTPSGGEVRFTATKVLSNSGKSSYYYAFGIKPDLYIELNLVDISNHRDAALEKAIMIVKE